MRDIHADVLAAMSAGKLVERDFLNVWPRDRSTGLEVEKGYWSGIGTVSAPVLNPLTGSSTTLSFRGVGSLIEISGIPLVANVTVQRVTIKLSHIDSDVMQLLRTYDLRQARVQVFRGWLSPDSRALIQQALPRFVGFVDGAPLETPAENEEGSFTLECVSHTQEMTRASTETRSDESQRRRNASDNFYQDTATVGEREMFWGKANGKIPAKATQRGGIFG